MTDKPFAEREALARFAKELSDRGKLIEAGWVILQYRLAQKGRSRQALEDARLAFLAGAQHLFASVFDSMDDGDEPTEADMDRMSKAAAELDRARAELHRWLD